jgi:FkbM family methyltransferase
MIAELLQCAVKRVPYGWRRYIHSVPGLAQVQRVLIARYLEWPFLHTVDAGPAKGLRCEIKLPLDKALWIGTYEEDFAWALAGQVQSGAICYDIGGYRGYMSGIMALAGASAVFVFEPLPANQQALRRLCELNPDLPIKILPVAAGASDGDATFNVMSELSMGKLAHSSFVQDTSAVEEIRVTLSKIDTLVHSKAIAPPDIIKIDVEGAELDVLKGARITLQEVSPLVFLEVHSSELEASCQEFLKGLGYRVGRVSKALGSRYPLHLHAAPVR